MLQAWFQASTSNCRLQSRPWRILENLPKNFVCLTVVTGNRVSMMVAIDPKVVQAGTYRSTPLTEVDRYTYRNDCSTLVVDVSPSQRIFLSDLFSVSTNLWLVGRCSEINDSKLVAKCTEISTCELSLLETISKEIPNTDMLSCSKAKIIEVARCWVSQISGQEQPRRSIG